MKLNNYIKTINILNIKHNLKFLTIIPEIHLTSNGINNLLQVVYNSLSNQLILEYINTLKNNKLKKIEDVYKISNLYEFTENIKLILVLLMKYKSVLLS